jgi:acetyl-CoA C-acetyltransferase
MALPPEERAAGLCDISLAIEMLPPDRAESLLSEIARELGIPEDRWVYLWGCGDANDKWFVSERVNYHSSPAIRAATERALGMAGIIVNDIGAFDLYSCFPSAVQIAAREIGVTGNGRPLTVTGGLGFAGGPVNNYPTHAIAAMVEVLRRDPQAYGLTTALGWYVTKHAVGVWSARPPEQSFTPSTAQAEVDALPSRTPAGLAACGDACVLPAGWDADPKTVQEHVGGVCGEVTEEVEPAPAEKTCLCTDDTGAVAPLATDKTCTIVYRLKR